MISESQVYSRMNGFLDRFFNPQKLVKKVPIAGPMPDASTMLTKAFKIAWPSLTESVLIGLVGMIDTMMVSTLGTYAIAAVGLTTQPKFIGLSFFLSLNIAISALVARRRGEKDADSAKQVLLQSLAITLLMTAVISTLCVVFADPILRLSGSAPDTHEDAVIYFRIIMGGMVFNTISMVINAAQRGCGNTKIALRTNVTSNVVNIVFNYLLIGGNFGFPKLGVAGAAIATVIGTVAACVMSIISILHTNGFLRLSRPLKLRFDRRTLGGLANIGSSTLAEQIFLRIGFFISAIIVARLGTEPFATHQICMNILSLAFCFGDGLSVAAVSLVGQSMGQRRVDLAQVYGSICQRIGFLISILLGIVFFTCGRGIVGLFTTDPAILDNGSVILDMMSLIVLLQISQVIFNGCLRGAGDTRFVAVISLISVTFVRPFSSWLLCYPLGWGLYGAWIGLAIDQIVRFALSRYRFGSGKWTKIEI